MVRQVFAKYFTVFYAFSDNLSGGCFVFFKRDLVDVSFGTVVAGPTGQYLVVDFTISSTPVRLINVYAPCTVQGRRSLFLELTPFMRSSIQTILLGDFNCVLCPEDRLGGCSRIDASAALLREELDRGGYVDVVNYAHGSTLCYTHAQGSSRARLDRIYVNFRLRGKISYSVATVYFSDHCCVSFTVPGAAVRRRKIDFLHWKFNSSLLSATDFVAGIQRKIPDVRGPDNIVVLWEEFKCAVKEDAIRAGVTIAFESSSRLRLLEAELRNLTFLDEQSPGV